MTPGLELSPIGDELLDDPAADRAVVEHTLGQIARANWWFGGTLALRFALRTLLGDAPAGTRASLLDIGTGAGDLPLAARRWAARRGIELRPLGLERSQVAARMAARSGVATILGCAGQLPIRPKSVDLVLMNLFAHHFAPASVVRLLREADRIARRGVIVSDLRRSPVAATGFWLGASALGFDRVTIRDGVTSVRRGYSAASLAALLSDAGVRGTVHRRPGWRLVALWRPAAA